MPPRHAYWTIIIDDQPTAFRAHDAEELLPTLNRLKEKNPTAVMKWFERGKLFDSRDAARDSGGGEGERRWEGPRPERSDRDGDGGSAPPARGAREGPRRETDRRDRTWRPGGEHKDPRQKYKDASKAKWDRFKKNIRDRSERGRAAAASSESPPEPPRERDLPESTDVPLVSDFPGELNDPETFTPPHGDPLREHIDDDIGEMPEGGRTDETSDDRPAPRAKRPAGAQARAGDDAPERRDRPPRDRERPPGRDRGDGDRDRPSRGYQGSKPWGGENRERPGSDRERRTSGSARPPQREGGWRPEGPPSGDRSPRDRPERARTDDRNNDRGGRSGSGGRSGYEGKKPWGGPPSREGGWRPQGPPGGDRPYGDRPPRGKWDSRDAPRASDRPGDPSRSRWESGESRGRTSDRSGESRGPGGYQGKKPWSAPPSREGGWRPQGPPAGDRPYGDRPPRGKWESRDAPRGDDRSGGSTRSGGYQGKKPWGAPPSREGGWRPPAGDRPYGERPPRAKWDSRDSSRSTDRSGESSRGKSESGESRSPSDRARQPWGPKPGGGKPWGAGPGNRPGGGKPWGAKPSGSRPPGGKSFDPRGPRKRRDEE